MVLVGGGSVAAAVGRRLVDLARPVLQVPGRVGGALAGRTGIGVDRAVFRSANVVIYCPDGADVAEALALNRDALGLGVPVLFVQVEARRALVGPLVVPGATACYECFRYRWLTCQDGPAEVLLREIAVRAAAPTRVADVPPPLAGAIAEVVVRALPAAAARSLPPTSTSPVAVVSDRGRVGRTRLVLRRDDCPACAAVWGRGPDLGTPEDVPPLRLRSLVDPQWGVVRRIERLPPPFPGPPTGHPSVTRARMANYRLFARGGESLFSYGKGWDARSAVDSAVGEALERWSSWCWTPSRLMRGPAEGLPLPAVSPRSLVLYRDEQYSGIPYRPYHEDMVLTWVEGRILSTGEATAVPALAAFLGFPGEDGEPRIFEQTSCGLACAPTLEAATLSGILEVLERDAFLLWWLTGLPSGALDPASHPDPRVRHLGARFQDVGCDLLLLRLPTDHPVHVVAAFALARASRPEWPAVALGLGAAPTAAEAATGAVLELTQVFTELGRRLSSAQVRGAAATLADGTRPVRTPADHGLLYAHPSSLERVAGLRGAPPDPGGWAVQDRVSPRDTLERLVRHLADRGDRVVVVDLTPPSLERSAVRTVRVVVPGLQPMHFDEGARRLGGRRLFEAPLRFGRDAPVRPSDLRPDPHPLC